mgnify:CR=1 FL=1
MTVQTHNNMIVNPFQIEVSIDIEKFFQEVPSVCQKEVMLKLFRVLQFEEVARAIFNYNDIKLFEQFSGCYGFSDDRYDVMQLPVPWMIARIEDVAGEFVNKLVAFLKLVDEDDEAKAEGRSPTVRKVLYAAFIIFEEEHVEEAIAQYRREVNLPMEAGWDDDDEEEVEEETDQAEDHQALP